MSDRRKTNIARITYSSDAHSSNDDQSSSSNSHSRSTMDDNVGHKESIDQKTHQILQDQGSSSQCSHLNNPNKYCTSTDIHFNAASVLIYPNILSRDNLLALLDDRGICVNHCMDKVTLIRLYQQYVMPRAKRPDRPLSERLRAANQQDDILITSIDQAQNSTQSQLFTLNGNPIDYLINNNNDSNTKHHIDNYCNMKGDNHRSIIDDTDNNQSQTNLQGKRTLKMSQQGMRLVFSS